MGTLISALTDGGTIQGTDTIPVVRSGATKRATLGGTPALLDSGSRPEFTSGIEAHVASDREGVAIGESAGIGEASPSGSVNIGFFTAAGDSGSGGVPGGAYATRVGRHAGFAADISSGVAIGHAAFQYGYDSASGIAIGYEAGRNPGESASYHAFEAVLIGHLAGRDGGNHANSVAIGTSAAQAAATATNSVVIGTDAGAGLTGDITGAVIIGPHAGDTGSNAVNSVYIGNQAGQTLDRSNSLVIETNATYAPSGVGALIYGEFDTRKLKIGGSLSWRPPSSIAPANNGDLTVEATSNTTLTFKLKGSDGTVRSGTLTLS